MRIQNAYADADVNMNIEKLYIFKHGLKEAFGGKLKEKVFN